MSNLSPTCQKVQKQLDTLKNKRASLQAQLQKAAPAMKSEIATQIKELNTKIAAKQKELNECIKKHPYVPPEGPKPNPCPDEKQRVEKLRAALRKEVQEAVAALQAQLQKASPAEKAAIVERIKETRERIEKNSPTAKKLAEARKAYEKCLIDRGGVLELRATFRGTATLRTSDRDASGPFSRNVTIGLHFSEWDHGFISVTSFPTIVVGPFDTPVGDVTTTVSYLGDGGTFNPQTNRITLNLSLFFHHDHENAGDSRFDVLLTTTSPLDKEGRIRLEGSSTFQEGYLGDETGWLVAEGTIEPRP